MIKLVRDEKGWVLRQFSTNLCTSIQAVHQLST